MRITTMLATFLAALNGFSQITIDNTTYNTTQLVDGILVPAASGTVISNVQFSGVYNSSNRYQVGYFSTAGSTQTDMGIGDGVVLSTGSTANIPLTLGTDPGSVAQMSTGYVSCTAGEIRETGTCATFVNDVNILAGPQNYYNAAILEFDFVPVDNFVEFRYIFGSEEYEDNSGLINYQCSSYNDKFGFLISGPGISGGQGYDNDARNIARLANGSEVGINSVNNGIVGSSGGAPNATNCQNANPAWVENVSTAEFLGPIDGTQLNGNTIILTATQSGLTPGQTYHIKLIITDVDDAAYDAVVYLEAGSFTTENPCVVATPTITSSPATCSADGTSTVSNYDGTLTYTFTPAGPSVGAGGAITGMTLGASYTLVADNGSCSSSSSASFSNDAQLVVPATPLITTTAATCAADGSSTVSNYDGSLTYTFTPAGPSVGAGGAITGMTIGTTYTLEADNGTCTSSSSTPFSNDVQLSVPATPVIATTSATCSADGNSTVSNYDGTLTYTFTPAGPSVGAGGTISGMSLGTSYTLQAENGSCSSSPSTSFSNDAQLAVPATPLIATTAATCSADGTSSVSNYDGTLTYTFTPLGPSIGAGGSITGMTAGTTYTLEADNGTCTSSSSALFSNDAQLSVPVTPLITTTGATCSADGTATIDNYDGTLTYAFTPAGPTAGAGGMISGMNTGTSYTVIADNGSCASTTSAGFTIDAQLVVPATPLITSVAATCLADGSSSVSNYDGTLTYTFTPAGPSVGAVGAITGMTIGTSYTLEANNGTCTSLVSSSFSNDAQLSVPVTPSITTTVATCSADGTVTIDNYDGTLTYAFTPSGPTVGAGGAITGLTAGTSYDVVADNGSCSSTASASFSINSQLIAETIDLGTDQTVASNQDLVLTAIVSGPGNVTWDNGTTGLSITFNLTSDTEVCATITDTNGCTNTDCVYFTVETVCSELFVPSAFSPNGDNNNDSFGVNMLNLSCIEDMTLSVFDRWGKVVFTTTDPNERWFGEYQSEKLDPAVFHYLLDIKLVNENEYQQLKGNVTLIK